MKTRSRLVHGVGINDAEYSVKLYQECPRVNGKRRQKLVWICPFYSRWKDMLKRAYSDKYKSSYPTYSECSVCEEWFTLSNFRSWMETQNWKGRVLDKDLLFPGNKVYCPEACVFIDEPVNLFVVECDSVRGEWPIGVYFNTRANKFQAQCRNPFSNKTENLGLYSSPYPAHKVWIERKLALAKQLAAEQDDPRVAEALIKRYENYGR